jgi:hypothetical protein
VILQGFCSILDERCTKSKVATQHNYLKVTNEKRDLALQHEIDLLNAHIVFKQNQFEASKEATNR